MNRLSPTVLLSLSLILVAVPASADMFKPGVKDQIALGKRAAEDIRKNEKVLKDDDPRVVEVRAIGKKLLSFIPAAELKKKPFEYSFDVVDSKDLNAFALPGGPVFVYSGLVDKLTTQDEIAGIIAHELTHVRNEHWASAYADNQKRQLGLTILLTVLNANSTAFNIAGVSDELLFTLPYSRKHESEADRIGYDLMVKAGYNPQGMIDVFEILEKQSGGGKSSEWYSDHPALANRIEVIRQRISKEGKAFPAERPLHRGTI